MLEDPGQEGGLMLATLAHQLHAVIVQGFTQALCIKLGIYLLCQRVQVVPCPDE